MKYYIGIDLGGTNIAGGLVDENGKILKKISVPTEVEKGENAIIDKDEFTEDELKVINKRLLGNTTLKKYFSKNSHLLIFTSQVAV